MAELQAARQPSESEDVSDKEVACFGAEIPLRVLDTIEKIEEESAKEWGPGREPWILRKVYLAAIRIRKLAAPGLAKTDAAVLLAIAEELETRGPRPLPEHVVFPAELRRIASGGAQ